MLTEFGFIENLKKNRNFSRIGDDCAVLPKDSATDLVVTADMLVEEIDFKLKWGSPADIGHKALAVSLSDIAAMGGRPAWSMVSIAVPERLWRTGFGEDFYRGYIALAERFGVEIVGGDISRSPDRFVVDSIIAGEVPKGAAILRSGARPGDAVWVSGVLGGAAAQLSELLSDKPIDAGRLMRPEPRVELGLKLLESGSVTSMIDISDGLAGDLRHICVASGVGAQIEADRVPVDLACEADLSFALHGGEDFELLLTAPNEVDLNQISAALSRIGLITSNVEMIELVTDGMSGPLAAASFTHF